MDWLLRVDWRKAFVPELSVAEIFLRGTAVYFLLFAFLRILRRESGAIGITDLLVVVLIADAAQNAMAGEYVSITEGALLVGTIAVWDYALDWLGYHSPRVARLLRPAPLALVKNGRMLRRNMRRELITEEELMSQLRQQGVGELSEVARACLEGDGRISVLKREPGAESGGGSGAAAARRGLCRATESEDAAARGADGQLTGSTRRDGEAAAVSQERFQTYEEFWPHYLAEHSRPATRWLHAAGTLTGLALLVFFAATARWAWLPLALVPGYGLAWAGHFFVERNRPATFAHPWWSFVSDFRMIWLLATGRLGRHPHAPK